MKLNEFRLIGMLIMLVSKLAFASGCENEPFNNYGVTVNIQKEVEATYKVISFDSWTLVTSTMGGVALHDKSPYDPTIAVNSKGVGISYALLDSNGNISGQVSDLDQDGLPDLKLLNNGNIEVYIQGMWRVKSKDDNGSFVIINGVRSYMDIDPAYGKYVLR